MRTLAASRSASALNPLRMGYSVGLVARLDCISPRMSARAGPGGGGEGLGGAQVERQSRLLPGACGTSPPPSRRCWPLPPGKATIRAEMAGDDLGGGGIGARSRNCSTGTSSQSTIRRKFRRSGTWPRSTRERVLTDTPVYSARSRRLRCFSRRRALSISPRSAISGSGTGGPHGSRALHPLPHIRGRRPARRRSDLTRSRLGSFPERRPLPASIPTPVAIQIS